MTANFYPRPPRGGRPGQRHCADHLQNFYPRPPRGGRPATALHRGKAAVFLSTPSARRATCPYKHPGSVCAISIHALREEGDRLSCPCAFAAHISIHALREEGDRRGRPAYRSPRNFYPRPPRGGRPHIVVGQLGFVQFLSTPSARRATCLPVQSCTSVVYFYPRPPRGGRPNLPTTGVKRKIFLSTPSARRATDLCSDSE